MKMINDDDVVDIDINVDFVEDEDIDVAAADYYYL